jgi:hypothetical protein
MKNRQPKKCKGLRKRPRMKKDNPKAVRAKTKTSNKKEATLKMQGA